MKGWKPSKDEDGIESQYHHTLDGYLDSLPTNSLPELEKIMVKAAQESDARNLNKSVDRKWITDEISILIQKRREAQDKDSRRQLSKDIHKKIRKSLRQWKNQKIEDILQEFQELSRLDQI
eukprot:451275-Karenia_brevis.AAC.1